MTWMCLIVATVAVAVMAHLAQPDGLVIHEYAYYCWQAFGVLVTAFLTVLPTLAMRSHFVLKNITVIRALLLISDTVWCTGSTAVVGGIAGPFWFCFIGGPIGLLMYMLKYRQRVVDDIVVNMVDVGEETGELDTMLYKVADTYDEEVAVLTDGLTKLMEPLLIIFLGGAVGFIVIALFVPLVDLINNLSG